MVIDTLGRSFHFVEPPRRVVSLVPSLTESLFELGAGSSLVGITDFCIFPEEGVAALPRIGGTKNPDIEEIRLLEPDLVYLNVEENVKRHAEAISAFAPVFATEPKTVGDVMVLLDTLGRIHRRESAARSFVERIEAALEVRHAPFTFVVPIWKDPWMWCGGDTYVSSLVTAAGGVNVLQNELRYPARSLAEIASLHPEVVFLPDEPYPFHAAEAESLAPIASRIVGPFPGHLFTWHGTRTLLGLKQLHVFLTG